MSAKRSVALADRLYSWEHYAAVARMVRYETLLYDDAKPYIEELERRFGADKVREAVADVCRTNWHEQPVTIGLRPEVRKHCFQLLGPAPEQEDAFYRHPDGTPRERPPKKPPDALAWKAGDRPTPAPKTDSWAKGRGAKRKPTTYQEVSGVVTEGTVAHAKAAEPPPLLKIVPKPEPDLRAMKRRYRTLVKAFRAFPADSPARVAIKADIQALRREIHAAGGGTVI
jgi:hypothetical protein